MWFTASDPFKIANLKTKIKRRKSECGECENRGNSPNDRKWGSDGKKANWEFMNFSPGLFGHGRRCNSVQNLDFHSSDASEFRRCNSALGDLEPGASDMLEVPPKEIRGRTFPDMRGVHPSVLFYKEPFLDVYSRNNLRSSDNNIRRNSSERNLKSLIGENIDSGYAKFKSELNLFSGPQKIRRSSFFHRSNNSVKKRSSLQEQDEDELKEKTLKTEKTDSPDKNPKEETVSKGQKPEGRFKNKKRNKKKKEEKKIGNGGHNKLLKPKKNSPDDEGLEKSRVSRMFRGTGFGKLDPVNENSHRPRNRGDRPVSGLRGVEKRPDTVRESEERPQNHDDSNTDNHLKSDFTHHASKVKNSATNINRSESYRERIPQKKIREKRKTSDPNLSKTNDVNLDSQGLSYNTNSGSSSNSSLSARSLDSPSGGVDMVTASQQRSQESITVTLAPSNISPLLEDSDTEAEADPPDWTKTVDERVLQSVSPREKKRQEVINELFHTEKSHVRKLKVLDQVFLKPMQENQILPSDQLNLLFQNLEEMLDIHCRFNNAMKAKKKERPLVGNIGDILLAMFDGPAGDNFQRAASVFCANQQIALEQLKERRKKDQKLNNFLTEAESNPLCRRLQLKDMLPTVMQRLTKYPLLFENIAKYSLKGSDEDTSVQLAVERSKDILNYVNQAVRAVEDYQRLAEIQKKLDKSAFEKVDHPMANEFKNLDLRTHKLIYEGSLNWRIGNRQKLIDIHVLLLQDVIILLQKQDDKYVLKFYNVNTASGGAPPLSPIVKVSSVLVRDNAVDKTALYLVNTSHSLAQIYDLVASSPNERKIWFRHITEAADAYKQKDNVGRNRTASTLHSPCDTFGEDDSSLRQRETESESQATFKNRETSDLESSETSQDVECSQSGDNSQQQINACPPNPSPSLNTSTESSDHGKKSVDSSPSQRRKVEPVRLSTVQDSLIQPSEVVVLQKPILTAEPVLTPLEQIRVKDEEIRKALLTKQQLVAEVLHVPKEEFETIAEMAGEPSVDKEAAELVLAAVNQANQLTVAVNEALRVTEEEAVTVTSEVLPGRSPRGGRRKTRLPGVPAIKLQAISSSLNFQLTQLLKIIKERDEERELLRKELQRSREQIHVLHEGHRKSGKSPVHSKITEDASEESGDLTRDQVTELKAEGEEAEENSLLEDQQSQDPNSDVPGEVFVDALSDAAESSKKQPEPSESAEDFPV